MELRNEGSYRNVRPYTYHGHRKKSYTATDKAEIVELRARMRTFDGGYMRSTLMTLGTAVVFIRLFDERFYNIGILFMLLSGLLFFLALARRKHSDRDFSDQRKVLPVSQIGLHASRIFGGPFITAGRIVLIVSAVVIAAEVTLMAFILHLEIA